MQFLILSAAFLATQTIAGTRAIPEVIPEVEAGVHAAPELLNAQHGLLGAGERGPASNAMQRVLNDPPPFLREQQMAIDPAVNAAPQVNHVAAPAAHIAAPAAAPVEHVAAPAIAPVQHVAVPAAAPAPIAEEAQLLESHPQDAIVIGNDGVAHLPGKVPELPLSRWERVVGRSKPVFPAPRPVVAPVEQVVAPAEQVAAPVVADHVAAPAVEQAAAPVVAPAAAPVVDHPILNQEAQLLESHPQDAIVIGNDGVAHLPGKVPEPPLSRWERVVGRSKPVFPAPRPVVADAAVPAVAPVEHVAAPAAAPVEAQVNVPVASNQEAKLIQTKSSNPIVVQADGTAHLPGAVPEPPLTAWERVFGRSKPVAPAPKPVAAPVVPAPVVPAPKPVAAPVAPAAANQEAKLIESHPKDAIIVGADGTAHLPGAVPEPPLTAWERVFGRSKPVFPAPKPVEPVVAPAPAPPTVPAPAPAPPTLPDLPTQNGWRRTPPPQTPSNNGQIKAGLIGGGVGLVGGALVGNAMSENNEPVNVIQPAGSNVVA